MKVKELRIPGKLKNKYMDSGITELNPPQEKAVEAGVLDGEDIVVASPTASGKTLIAEMAIAKRAMEGEETAVYVVPLKALAGEKYNDFSDRFDDLDVRMSVGDRDDAGDYLETADLVIVTSEKLDSMLRHNPSWIHDIGLVAVDEIHLLTSENRGPTLEVTIARLRKLLDFQLLGLSATISNSSELADWLDAKLVESSYRPVELKEGIFWNNEIEFYTGEDLDNDFDELEGSTTTEYNPSEGSSYSTGKEMKDADLEDQMESETYTVQGSDNEKPAVKLVEDTLKLEKQAIIFCSSRNGAEKSADRNSEITAKNLSRKERKQLEEYADKIENALGSPTSQCRRLANNVKKGAAFHHAGLVREQREAVEEAFREGLLKTVSATPTLAAGVNLPAFRVIMRDLKRYTGRGMEYIPVLEFEQMCLSYNQKLVLPTGERRSIGEIVEQEQNIEVLSYGEEIEPKKVIDHYSRESTVIQIETETGEMILTGNHPVMTKDGWTDASELEEGQEVKLVAGTSDGNRPFFYELISKDSYVQNAGKIIEEYKQEFELTDREIASELDISKSTVYHYKNNRKACPVDGILRACKELGMSKSEIAETIHEFKSEYGNVITPPKRIQKDFMWLIGIVLTDGNLNKTKDKRTGSTYTAIRVFNTDENIIDKAKSVFNSLGLECYQEEREEDKFRLEVGNTLLAEMMNDVFGVPYGKKSDKTEIPEIIFGLEEELQAGFIEGVFDGDGSYYKNKEKYKQRVHFSSSSQDFITDLRELFASFGVKSRVDSKYVDSIQIKEDEYQVDKTSYSLRIRNKKSIDRLSDIMSPVKAEIKPEKYSKYHNLDEHRKNSAGFTEILKIDSKDQQKVYNVEVEENHNYVLSNRTLLHNCGRAGRPGFDDRGEAIAVAKQPGQQEEILERYIIGEAERIQSKLAVEPVLRMHTLSLVASEFTTSMEQLLEFYSETLYAHQFGDMEEVESKVKGVVQKLREYEFIEEDELKATKTGRRVSELYLDPDSAHLILNCLKKAEGTETRAVSYLFMISRTTEIRTLRVRDKEFQEIGQALMDAEPYLLEQRKKEWEPGFESQLEAMKTALMFQGWISEVDEERLMEKYDVAPGGVRAKTRNADWLLFGAQELANLEEIDLEGDLQKLRTRLEHGIEEELLKLVKYDQIGRVRARKLHDYGIRSRGDIRNVSFEKLKKLIGNKTARKLKKQVGEENIFDRENITDYFED